MGQLLFKEPKKELENCLVTLYRMLDNIHDYDGMEIANYMSCRDDAQMAIEQLNGNIDLSPYLEKLGYLDQKIRENAQYISESMDSHFVRNYRRTFQIPRSWWWWYLDEFIAETDKWASD
ncbi:hypothetical protein H8E77_37375 [bacterium]|nr:hypothetical protein [bacterium]